MKKLVTFLGTLLVFSFLLNLTVRSEAPTAKSTPDPDPVKVLFIGNTLTSAHRMPDLLCRIAALNGRQLQVDYSLCRQNNTLKKLWEEGKALQLLKSPPTGATWDYVVLQEHSVTVQWNTEQFRSYAGSFDREIKNAKARTILFITNDFGSMGRAVPAIHTHLTQNYLTIAEDLNTQVAPAGPAWVNVCKQNPDLALYEKDDIHPSLLGAYLTAIVFYQLIFKEQPQAETKMTAADLWTDFTPDPGFSIPSPETVALFQKTAWKMVDYCLKNYGLE